MPSQLTGRILTVSSYSNSVLVNKAVDTRALYCDNDMQAAARTVGSLLAHNCSRKSVSSLQEVCKPNNISQKPLSNGSNTPFVANQTVRQNGHSLTSNWNAMATQSPLRLDPSSPKTEGAHSSDQSSLTNHSNTSRLICPKLAIRYAGNLVTRRAGDLANKQKVLETHVAVLQKSIRQRQLRLIHTHTSTQLKFIENTEQETRMAERSSTFSDTLKSDPLTQGGSLALPIQVDGASDDTFLIQVSSSGASARIGSETVEVDCADVRSMPSRTRCEDSFSSFESYVSNSGSSYVGSEVDWTLGQRSVGCVKAQLASLESLVDPDLTDTSSNEDEGEDEDMTVGKREQQLRGHAELNDLWEEARMAVGSRWAWLHCKIAELNKQIYLLDHHVKNVCCQDHCIFGSNPSVLPHYLPFPNGSVMDKLRVGGGGHMGGLVTLGKAASMAKHNKNNGFSQASSLGHAQYLPHLLLSESLLGAKLQVKDLLSPSPLGHNLLRLEETHFTAARTRPLVRRARGRKVIRKKRAVRTRGNLVVDPAYHPHLSMTHELPSRVLLDSVMKDILSEHSYAQLPLRKRRKAASSLAQLYTPPAQVCNPQAQGCEHSSSPSPIYTPLSLDSNRGAGSSRKKASFIHHQASLESLSSASPRGGCTGSPWSPGLSRPVTPGLTTSGLTPFLPPARRKRMTSSTPLFDIDNIVIPYSIASSTRLEKLEYKEILTPSWRQVEAEKEKERVSPKPMETLTQEKMDLEEDLSDLACARRHNRSELTEKKRFLNFITGSNHRKRARPQSVTLSDSPGVRCNSPPARRPTIASPTPTELELPRLPEVLPWQQRTFPLNAEEEDALENPPPPLPVLFPSSPLSHLHTSTPSHSPSCTTSAYTTPLASPLSTPSEDTPASSPAEWVVNSHLNTSSIGPFLGQQQPQPRVLTSAPFSHHHPIILKLTKKT